MVGSSNPAFAIGGAPRPALFASLRATVPDFWALTKPEVNFLIVIATFTGFYLGCPSERAFPLQRLISTLCATLLVASGTGTLNQVLEHHNDARMRRTCRRPVAAGRLRPTTAAGFGISLSILGTAYLLLTASALASVLAVFTLLSYLFVYTPLKRKTPLCILVGAVPGAMPALIGWAAASGSINSEKAWMVYAVLLLWQFPHFMAIAWMYREDYARAGYFVLPTEHEHYFLGWMTAVPSIALFVASIAATDGSRESVLHYSGTLILGSGVLYYAARLIFLRSRIAARQLLKVTIIYLPLELLILVLGKS